MILNCFTAHTEKKMRKNEKNENEKVVNNAYSCDKCTFLYIHKNTFVILYFYFIQLYD